MNSEGQISLLYKLNQFTLLPKNLKAPIFPCSLSQKTSPVRGGTIAFSFVSLLVMSVVFAYFHDPFFEFLSISFPHFLLDYFSCFISHL